MLFTGYYLGGRGSLGRVTATGLPKTLAPGEGGAGTLSTRGLALDNETRVEFYLERATNTSIHVAGYVDLANAQLRFWGFPSSNPNQDYTLISNDGSDPVVGTFANLPEGALGTSNLPPGLRPIVLDIPYRGGPLGMSDVMAGNGCKDTPRWFPRFGNSSSVHERSRGTRPAQPCSLAPIPLPPP